MKRFLFLIGFLFSAIATASNWQLVGFTSGYDATFFDKDSVLRPTAGRVQVWVASVFYKDVPLAFPPYACDLILSLLEIDTKARRSRDLQTIGYKGAITIKSFNNVSEWRYVVPGSHGEEIFDQVLGKRQSIFGTTQGSFDELVKFGRQKAKVAMMYDAIIQNNLEQQDEAKRNKSKNY